MDSHHPSGPIEVGSWEQIPSISTRSIYLYVIMHVCMYADTYTVPVQSKNMCQESTLEPNEEAKPRLIKTLVTGFQGRLPSRPTSLSRITIAQDPASRESINIAETQNMGFLTLAPQ